MTDVVYQHLAPGSEPPTIEDPNPFSAVLIIESDIDWKWREKVSRWLVDSGCLFMMAWGNDCMLWDDSVDYANIDDFPDSEIPDERYVMTTWHDDEPMEEVFWFAQHAAHHPTTELSKIVLLDISEIERRSQLLAEFAKAYDLAERESE